MACMFFLCTKPNSWWEREIITLVWPPVSVITSSWGDEAIAVIIVGDPEIESSKILVICCDVSTWWDTWNSITSSRQNTQSNYDNTSQATVCHTHIQAQTSHKGLAFFSSLHSHSRVDLGLIQPLIRLKTKQLKGLPANLLIDYSFHYNNHTGFQVPNILRTATRRLFLSSRPVVGLGWKWVTLYYSLKCTYYIGC